MFRLIFACIIGYTLGRERKRHAKSGGSRTMAIVCMTACLIAILCQRIEAVGLATTFNFSRLLAYTIAGISFIGNGIIQKYDGDVAGLTTAASLLGCVVLGFCIGLTFYWYALMGTVLLYILLDIKYWNIMRDEDDIRRSL